tara:strand:+ start:9989 stop:11047 length:1059 start_codon:yes stop_codon:yes gene_type:complete
MEEKEQKLQENVDKLNNKGFGIYFFTMDTKGNATASVANIYEIAKILIENGYNAQILHEKNDYTSVETWLGEEYSSLPHCSIEKGELSVGPADFLVIPELFGHVAEQTAQLGCKKIILCQSYDYMFEFLEPGKRWTDFGITDCIAITDQIGEIVKKNFKTVNVDIIPLSIPEYFNKPTEPKKPIIAIHTREQRDAAKTIKSFYLQFPQYKWITFRDLRGLSRKEFANVLKECCCAIWIDDISGFGTFPVEAMKCGTPVIGKVPNLIPEWLTEDNGMWTYEGHRLPEFAVNFIESWLEDSIPNEITKAMEPIESKYKREDQVTKVLEVFEKYVKGRKEGMENHIKELAHNEVQ